MSIAEFISLLLFALMPFAFLLGFLALSYAAGEIKEHERRRARIIKGIIRNLATIFFVIAPLLSPLLIILWVASLW